MCQKDIHFGANSFDSKAWCRLNRNYYFKQIACHLSLASHEVNMDNKNKEKTLGLCRCMFRVSVWVALFVLMVVSFWMAIISDKGLLELFWSLMGTGMLCLVLEKWEYLAEYRYKLPDVWTKYTKRFFAWIAIVFAFFFFAHILDMDLEGKFGIWEKEAIRRIDVLNACKELQNKKISIENGLKTNSPCLNATFAFFTSSNSVFCGRVPFNTFTNRTIIASNKVEALTESFCTNCIAINAPLLLTPSGCANSEMYSYGHEGADGMSSYISVTGNILNNTGLLLGIFGIFITVISVGFVIFGVKWFGEYHDLKRGVQRSDESALDNLITLSHSLPQLQYSLIIPAKYMLVLERIEQHMKDERIRKIARENPRYAALFLLEAMYYCLKGDFLYAKRLLKDALENINGIDIYTLHAIQYRLAAVYIQLGDIEKAKKYAPDSHKRLFKFIEWLRTENNKTDISKSYKELINLYGVKCDELDVNAIEIEYLAKIPDLISFTIMTVLHGKCEDKSIILAELALSQIEGLVILGSTSDNQLASWYYAAYKVSEKVGLFRERALYRHLAVFYKKEAERAGLFIMDTDMWEMPANKLKI
jgi:tetratricopeptide (TPR) repeat protein